jgi:hypothetical protein
VFRKDEICPCRFHITRAQCSEVIGLLFLNTEPLNSWLTFAMFAKIKEIDERYARLENELVQPEVLQDRKHYQRLLKERSGLAPIVHTFRKYEALEKELANNRPLLDDPDPEIRKLAREEVDSLKKRSPRWRGISGFSFCPRTRMMIGISFWKSEPAQGARRPACSPQICLECMRDTRK